ncbi:hypothetical protein CBS101457_002951 [Exobasidium rhododendri]|nr:hypothetical protein CBS101457_002951 [Exobasidium rhododendri]
MSRTFSEQLGLKPDPHAAEHFKADGYNLTRTFTRGGHQVDSQQPGLPVYHRRIGNPYPLFAIGIGASVIMLGLIFLNARGLQNPQVFLNVGLPMGGFAAMTAAMFAFAEGNTFLATTAGTLAGLVGGLSIVFLPWAGIPAAYAAQASSPEEAMIDLYKALGIVLFASSVPSFILFLASFKTAVPISVAALCIVTALLLQGSAYISFPLVAVTKASGALLIIIGAVLWFSAISVLLQEEGIMILPVMPLPRME